MRRNIHFGFMLNQAEKKALDELAERQGGLSQAATLRMLLRKAAHEKGTWPPRSSEKDPGRDEAK